MKNILSTAILCVIVAFFSIQSLAVVKDDYRPNQHTGKLDNVGKFDRYSSKLHLATYSSNGLMSKEDKVKLDKIIDCSESKYGGVFDGIADDSAAVAACLADAMAIRGNALFPADAKIRVTQGFTLNQPIKIIGAGHMNFDHGSNFYIEETTDPLFTITHPAVEFHGVNFYYPLQDTTGTAIVAYPPTLRFVNGTDSRVNHCRFFNTYDGIKYENGARYNVDDVWMWTINKGIQILNTFDTNRFTNITFSYGAWINDFKPSNGMIEYTATNATGMYFEHADMTMLDRLYFFGLNKGIVLNAGIGDLTDNLFVDSCGWDSTRIGVEITGWANYLKVSNSMFVNFDGKYNYTSPPESPVGSNPLSYCIYNTHEFTSIEISNCVMSADGRAIWMTSGDVLNVSGGSIHTYGLAAANDSVPGYGIHATNLSELYVTGTELTNNPAITKTTITSIYAEDVDSVQLGNIAFGNVNRGVELAGTIGSISRSGLTYKSDVTNTDSVATSPQRLGSTLNSAGTVTISGAGSGTQGLIVQGALASPVDSSSTILFSASARPTTALTTQFGVTFNPTLTGDSTTSTDISFLNGFYARQDLASTYRGNIGLLSMFAIGNPFLNVGTATEITGLAIEPITGGGSNYGVLLSNPIKFRSGSAGSVIWPNGSVLNTGVAGDSGSIQYNNGSNGLSGGSYAKLAGADGGTLTITDLLWSGNLSQTFVKNSTSDTSTDKPPSAAALKSVSDRVPVLTSGYVPFSDGTKYTGEAAFAYDASTDKLTVGTAGTATALQIEGVTNSTRTTTATNTMGQAIIATHKTSADMVDGFGSSIQFRVTDSGATDQLLANIGAVRDGADNTGAISLRTSVAGSATEKMRIASSGLLTFSNGGGPPFGMMFTDTSFTVTVASSDTWYEADTGATNFTAGLLKNVTQSDHYMVAVTAGYYEVEVSASLGTGAAGDKVAITIAVNGAATSYGHGHTTIANAASTSHVTAMAILNLAANDQVSIMVQNHTAARNIEIDHAQAKMKYIGAP